MKKVQTYTHVGYEVKSIVACVPSQKVDADNESKRITEATGIKSRRIADDSTTAADLALAAARTIFSYHPIDKGDVGVLVLVTQYPDYILPSTAHIIKDKLGLSQDTVAIQVNEGCSGYIYGLHTLLSLLSCSHKSLGLLLTSDTTSKVIDPNDEGTAPLFGDGGAATLISKGRGDISIGLGSDGSDHHRIIVEGGGFKYPNVPKRLLIDGMSVFAFSIGQVPQYIHTFLADIASSPREFDFLVLHQANQMMNDRITKKLGFDLDASLGSLEAFGNTSVASIPITIALHREKYKQTSSTKLLCAGFGVGLSWGMAVITLHNTNIQLIDYEDS